MQSMQIPLQPFHPSDVRRPTHQHLHQPLDPPLSRQCLRQEVYDLHTIPRSCFVPLTLSGAAAPTAYPPLLRPLNTVTIPTERAGRYRGEDTARLTGRARNCWGRGTRRPVNMELYSQTRRPFRRQCRLSPLPLPTPDWLLGVHLIHLRRAIASPRPDAKRGIMVVLFHRDVRLLPRILPWGVLVALRGLRGRTKHTLTKTATFRDHYIDGYLRSLQAISKCRRHRSLLEHVDVVSACLSL